MQQAIERQETGVDAWFRAWAARDFTALAAMYHPEAEYERPDGRSAGVADVIAYLRALAAAAPQATATVQAAHFAPEAVTVEWTEQHAGCEPDRVVDVFRVRNGRIVAQRQYLDPTRRLRALAAYAARGTGERGQFDVADDPGATMIAGRPAEPAPAPPLAQSAQNVADGPAFRIDTGPDRGLLFPIAAGTFTIGRALDNRFVLRDPATSSHHARIESRPGELLVADLESTNGTYVNGERIRQRLLADGDRLGIGQNGLVVMTPGPAREG